MQTVGFCKIACCGHWALEMCCSSRIPYPTVPSHLFHSGPAPTASRGNPIGRAVPLPALARAGCYGDGEGMAPQALLVSSILRYHTTMPRFRGCNFLHWRRRDAMKMMPGWYYCFSLVLMPHNHTQPYAFWYHCEYHDGPVLVPTRDLRCFLQAAKPYSASKFVAEYKKYTQNHTARVNYYFFK